MMMPMEPSLVIALDSIYPTEPKEFDALLAILAEEEDLTIEEVLSLFEKEKANLPQAVVEFMEARLGTFKRNINFMQETLDEERLKCFFHARVHTFAQNMYTISSLLRPRSRPKTLEGEETTARAHIFVKNMVTIASLIKPARPPQENALELTSVKYRQQHANVFFGCMPHSI